MTSRKRMIVREIFTKSILSKSQIQDYAINPYVGCSHACRYCYAAFMRRFTGHKEKWGEFVDIKVNAPDLLAREIKKKRLGRVWVSGVCDPYQSVEKRYKLTARYLKILLENQWPVTIQTKSSLVLRDIDIFEKFKNYANRIYIKNKMEWAKEDSFFINEAQELKEGFMRQKIPVRVLF